MPAEPAPVEKASLCRQVAGGMKREAARINLRYYRTPFNAKNSPLSVQTHLFIENIYFDRFLNKYIIIK
jgi:hypothetical protein